MNYNYSCPVNELDSIRRARGTRSCRSAFYRLAQNRSETALRLINDDARYRCVSNPGELTFPNYLRLENDNISAQDAAKIIKDHFRF